MLTLKIKVKVCQPILICKIAITGGQLKPANLSKISIDLIGRLSIVICCMQVPKYNNPRDLYGDAIMEEMISGSSVE